jgi:CheY-like chemotaxis protein
LLVEDEVVVARAAEDMLRILGFEPICVTTAAEALDVLRTHPQLALAFIDVGLPDRRGDDLAAECRAAAPSLAVVIASGYDGAELLARFADDAKTTVLDKPYSDRDLQAAIASLGL